MDPQQQHMSHSAELAPSLAQLTIVLGPDLLQRRPVLELLVPGEEEEEEEWRISELSGE